MKRLLSIGIILLFIGMSISSSITSEQISIGDVITVDDEGDGDYTSIKEALNNSNPGDIIEIYSGTYEDRDIKIETENITLKGIPYELGSGNDTGKPFLDGKGQNLFYIRANWVTFSGFHLENNGNVATTINLYNVSNCLISENDVSHMLMSPIYCKDCSKIKIINNTLSHSGMRQGINFHDCDSFTISGNTITDCPTGILVWDSHHNLISNNRIIRCNRNGIDIVGDFNTIYRNHIEDNDEGLYIGDSIFTIVKQNNFINNSYNAYCSLKLGFYPAFLNRWINNYWDDWIGIGPKVIPGTILIFIPRLNFDWRPAKEPYPIEV